MSRAGNWEDKMKLVSEAHPNIMNVDWEKLFVTDPSILGDLINDLIRVANSTKNPGRRGKRSNVDKTEAMASLSKLQGVDYSNDDFISTLKKLKGDRSIRKFAKDVGLGHSKVQRLLDGTTSPDFEVLSQIAKAHDKDLSFFLEYRIGVIGQFMSNILTEYPESSVAYYRKLMSCQ